VTAGVTQASPWLSLTLALALACAATLSLGDGDKGRVQELQHAGLGSDTVQNASKLQLCCPMAKHHHQGLSARLRSVKVNAAGVEA
jgi:hypothetical protein